MTLLGADGFKMGVAGTSSMDMSLDDLIKSRRNTQPKSIKKSVSNADKSIATSRAKRNAKMDSRRGLQTNKRPTNTQVDQEIKKQAGKTAIANAKVASQMKHTSSNKTGQEKAAQHRQKREAIKQGKAAIANVKPPSKKAVEAAVNAMQSAGFTMPPGQQMVISFAPIPGTAATTVKGPLSQPKKQNTNNNQNKIQNNTGGNNRNSNNRRRTQNNQNN